MTYLHQKQDYPSSIFPTPQIEKEIEDTKIAFERHQRTLEQLGFTEMPAWNGSMYEYVNRPQARRH